MDPHLLQFPLCPCRLHSLLHPSPPHSPPYQFHVPVPTALCPAAAPGLAHTHLVTDIMWECTKGASCCSQNHMLHVNDESHSGSRSRTGTNPVHPALRAEWLNVICEAPNAKYKLWLPRAHGNGVLCCPAYQFRQYTVHCTVLYIGCHHIGHLFSGGSLIRHPQTEHVYLLCTACEASGLRAMIRCNGGMYVIRFVTFALCPLRDPIFL